jgi:hypothetical protein
VDAQVIPLESRRLERAERMTALVDGVSALTIALEARERLARGGPAAALGWAELGVAALLVVTAVLVVRGRSELGRWVSGLAGVVLLLEGVSKTWGPKGHPSYALLLNGLVLLAVAGAAPWLDGRRRALRVLRLDDDGVGYRRNRFRRFSARREEIARVTLDGRAAILHARDGGTHRIDLADLHNADAARDALVAWASSHGVPIGDGPANAAAIPDPPPA